MAERSAGDIRAALKGMDPANVLRYQRRDMRGE